MWTISLRWATGNRANWVSLRISTRILQFTHWCILLLCEVADEFPSYAVASFPHTHILSSHFATEEFVIEVFPLLKHMTLLNTATTTFVLQGIWEMKIPGHVVHCPVCANYLVYYTLKSEDVYCSRGPSNRRPLWSSWAMFHFQLGAGTCN